MNAIVESQSNFRPDIEGLRAIAVLAVVAFHAGLGLAGGFAGVDVFFVISGYLISRQIMQDMQARRFSLGNFVIRRAWRILPALFVMLAATTVAALLLFMPHELALYGRSLMLATFSLSNFGFWLESGYFDASAQVKPLLHTWSLGVEWQFYLLLPFLLALHRKVGRPFLLLAIAGLCAVSIAAGLWLVHISPAAAFFLLPLRFWELGLGVCLALSPRFVPRQSWQAAAAVAVGLLLVGIAVVAGHGGHDFPAPVAFAAVGGAVMMIAGGRLPNAASNMLAVAPLRFVGRISYSLYLVHWPIIVFLQYRSGQELTVAAAIVAIAASLVLAWMLWRFVEQPFRRPVSGWRGPMPAMAAGAAALALAGSILLVGNGLPERLPLEVQRIYAAKADASPYASCIHEGKTSFDKGRRLGPGDVCSLNTEDGAKPPRFLVWGDSHAAALAPGIVLAAGRAGQSGYLAAHGGCPPLVDYDTPSPSAPRRSSCRAFNEAVMQMISREKLRLVFLVGRWPREILGAENGREGLFYDPKAVVVTTDRSRTVSAALDVTLAQLRGLGATPVLVMDVPEPGYDVPTAMARAAMFGHGTNVDPPRQRVDQRQLLERQVLVTAAARNDALLVDPTASFCDETVCKAERNGVPLYADADHLTRSAAEDLSPLFAMAFRRLEMLHPHMATAPLRRGQDFW